ASADGSVAAFDKLGHWQVPIFEDLAHFLFVLKWDSDRPQWSQFEEREHEFLRAYFGGNPVPVCSVRAFLLLIALDKWSSVVQGVRRARGLKKLAKRVLQPRRHRRFRQAVEQLLDGIRDGVKTGPESIPVDPSIERSA
ncbi:MAG: hypothetical protein IID45_09420, partial [Planctomycetes bacterium]|nr:hypothetical protein [Planctomycetota bacterium]